MKQQCNVKTRGLVLVRLKDGRWGDQYGRALKEYVNAKGETDLKPDGLYTSKDVA